MPAVIRLRLDLMYDGTAFSGWADQPNRRTVAGVLLGALATVLRVSPQEMSMVVAGRTDAGVHALGQVCQVDLPVEAWEAVGSRHPAKVTLVSRLRGVLPKDIVVVRVSVASPGFDARFSALWRRYHYRMCDDPAGVPPLRRQDVVAVRGWQSGTGPEGRGLAVGLMNQASVQLLGLRDFLTFCRPRAGATTIRTLQEFSWQRVPWEGQLDASSPGLVVATVRADAFCHHMVRSLVGAVLMVGQGRHPVSWPADMLAAGCRDGRVQVAPAHGLTLQEIAYPDDDHLAMRAEQSRVSRDISGGTDGCFDPCGSSQVG